MELLDFLNAETKNAKIQENEILNEFKIAIDKKSDYNLDKTFAKFAWTKEYFADIDKLLVNIGYVGNQADINKVQEFLRVKIEQCGILRFNRFLKENQIQPIYNHIQMLRDRIAQKPNVELNPSIYYPDRVDFYYLSRNPAAIELLEENPDKINWGQLSLNPAAMHLLEANPENINWHRLSSNPAAIHLLKTNPDNINWYNLSRNPAAIELIEANMHLVNSVQLSYNTAAVPLLEKYPNLINWVGLASNPAAIHILEENPTKIHWKYLSANPAAIDLLEENLDKINWKELCTNRAAIRIIEDNFEKINWISLSSNISAIHLLEDNPDKIFWRHLSSIAAFNLFKTYPNNIDWCTLSANKYDYKEEKLIAFNAAKLFPMSQLKI